MTQHPAWARTTPSYPCWGRNRGDGEDDDHHRTTVDLSVAVRGGIPWGWCGVLRLQTEAYPLLES